MSQYDVYAPIWNYKGGYGNSTREKIHNITADRFDQSFFPIEDLYAKVANDYAGQYVTTMGLQSRIKRDMAIDAQNPREKLPEDMVSAKMMDIVPMFGWSHPPDLSTPEDFKQNDQVFLIQSAFLNAAKQEALYTDPNLFFKQDLNTDAVGKGVPALRQVDYFSFDGSAIGAETNLLGGEERDESYRENSVESMTAF